jgi:hypothetical protein
VVKQDDQAGLLTRGEIREEVYYQLVARGEVAARIATNHMLELSAPLAIVELSIPYAHGEDLLPGDVFVWSWPDYGVDQMVLRVLSVTRGMLEDGNVRVRCTEDAYAWRDTVYSEPPASEWVDPVLPPLPALSLGIELPLLLWVAAARDTSPWARIEDFANDNRGVASLFARPQNVAHVGYDLYSEGFSNLPRIVDSGASWSGRVAVDGEFRPQTFGFEPQSATNIVRLKQDSAIPQVGDVVVFSFGSGKQPQEFVYVIARNFVSGAWELQIERALFDTDELFNTGATDGATLDPVGAIVGRLRDIEDPIQIDRKYSVDVPKDVIASGGESLLRAVTYTGSGVLSFADANQVIVPIEGRAFLPIPPYIALITETADRTIVAWRHRNRFIDRLVFTNQNVAPEPGVEYNLRIYEVEPIPRLLRSVSNIANDQNGYAYLFVDEETDRGGGLAEILRFEVEAERAGNQSYFIGKRIYRREPPQLIGDLYAWGFGSTGQLGTGDFEPRLQPTLIDLNSWSYLSAAIEFSLGIKAGSLYAWGTNSSGQLGTGDKTNRSVPTLIDSGGWSYVSGGQGSHSLGIKNESLYAWGSGSTGRLGTGDLLERLVPTLIDSEGWSYVSAGSSHSLGIKNGSLYAWGNNSSGQLGTGDVLQRTVPTLIDSGGWSCVATFSNYSLGIKNGNIYTWGSNGSGQLGTGDKTNRSVPTLIDSGGWSYVSGGGIHSLGIKNGNLYAWGSGSTGRLGTGDLLERLVPTLIDSEGWSYVSAGSSHSLGIKNGSLYAWGNNSSGRLGTGDTLQRTVPTLVSEGWLYAFSGNSHSLGIKQIP